MAQEGGDVELGLFGARERGADERGSTFCCGGASARRAVGAHRRRHRRLIGTRLLPRIACCAFSSTC